MHNDEDNPEILSANGFRRLKDDHPEIVRALKKGRGPQKSPTKEQVTVRLDPEILDFFRKSGARWQSRMNAVLKDYVAQH